MKSTDGFLWLRRLLLFQVRSHAFGVCLGVVSNWLIVSTELGAAATPGPLDQWHWRNPLPGGGGLEAVTYAEGRFVAAGDGGATATSVDGTNWISRGLSAVYGIGTNYSFQGIAGGNGIWVGAGFAQRNAGAGSFGILLSSHDVVTWEPQAIGEDVSAIWGIVYANGRFVAAGQGYDPVLQQAAGCILTSTDGLSWTVANSGLGEARPRRLRFLNSTFVLLSDSGRILTSSDALNWITWDSGISALYDCTYGNGFYISTTGNGILLSTDAVGWTSRIVPAIGGKRLAYGSGLFVAAGRGGELWTSPDLAKWTKRNSGTASDISDLTYGERGFVGVGNGALIFSTNGVDWVSLTSAITTTSLEDVTYGQGSFVAVGDAGMILQSTNGAAWRQCLSPLAGAHFYGAAYGGGNFVAVGAQGSLVTSSNGVDWAAADVGSAYLTDVSYGETQFVAVGTDGAILTSTNGSAWVVRDSGSASLLRGIAYGSGTFVVGAGATVLTSADGVQWAEHDTGIDPSLSWLFGLTYGGGVFVGVGNSGLILTSSNALDWSKALSGTSADLRSVTYGNGIFLVTGDAGTVLTSTNGMEWVSHDPGTMMHLSGAAYGAGTFVAVGPGGTILQSAVLPPMGALLSAVPGWSNAGFGLILAVPLGGPWEIQGSSNLVDWVGLGTVWTTNSRAQFVDGEASKFSRRFYRALGE